MKRILATFISLPLLAAASVDAQQPRPAANTITRTWRSTPAGPNAIAAVNVAREVLRQD